MKGRPVSQKQLRKRNEILVSTWYCRFKWCQPCVIRYLHDGGAPKEQISMDDPRLARFPDEVKRQIIRQSMSQQRDPDVMVVETCAITTRVVGGLGAS